MNSLYHKYQKLGTEEHSTGLLGTFLLVVIAILAQNLADIYVASLHNPYVGDLILDHLPTVDIDSVIIQMSLLLTLICILLVALKPKYIFFTIKTVSLFIIVRSFFISLTHLGISPHQIVFDIHNIGFSIYNFLYNTNGDFFFSAHTGLPVLMTFIFWKEKKTRIFFIIASLAMGTSVLLGHIHYSIDVFAAPFMAYGIYILSTRLFHKDYQLLESTEL